MNKNELIGFFKKNYTHWLEYAVYHCSKVGMEAQANDLLHEVLYAIWTDYDRKFLDNLMHKKGKGGTELDFFILRITRNIIYSTSKSCKPQYLLSIEQLEFSRSISPDVFAYDPEEDPERIKQQKIDLIEEALEHLDIAPRKLAVFKFYYLEGRPLKEWQGTEAQKTLYKMKNDVVAKIKKYIKKVVESGEKNLNFIF